jgi:hypothetical protein
MNKIKIQKKELFIPCDAKMNASGSGYGRGVGFR